MEGSSNSIFSESLAGFEMESQSQLPLRSGTGWRWTGTRSRRRESGRGPGDLLPGTEGGELPWRTELPSFQLLLPACWLVRPGLLEPEEQGAQATFGGPFCVLRGAQNAGLTPSRPILLQALGHHRVSGPVFQGHAAAGRPARGHRPGRGSLGLAAPPSVQKLLGAGDRLSPPGRRRGEPAGPASLRGGLARRLQEELLRAPGLPAQLTSRPLALQ